MSSKVHGRSLQQQAIIYRKHLAVGAALLFVMYLGLSSSADSTAARVRVASAGDDADDYAEAPPLKAKEKEKKKKKKVASIEQEHHHQPETLVNAGDFSVLYPPMQKRSSELVICPNVGNGGKNRQCSKGYIEFKFAVSEGTGYYLYVEAVGPTIMDNSLWVGTTDDNDIAFMKCESKQRAGPLVPHKHVSKSKWLCCPKYLAKNAKKGQGDFYTQCCFFGLGPGGKEKGCVLDLEVDSQPHWNQVPRKFTPSGEELTIRLYAREDGTAVTRLYLSTKAELGENDLR